MQFDQCIVLAIKEPENCESELMRMHIPLINRQKACLKCRFNSNSTHALNPLENLHLQ